MPGAAHGLTVEFHHDVASLQARPARGTVGLEPLDDGAARGGQLFAGHISLIQIAHRGPDLASSVERQLKSTTLGPLAIAGRLAENPGSQHGRTGGSDNQQHAQNETPHRHVLPPTAPPASTWYLERRPSHPVWNRRDLAPDGLWASRPANPSPGTLTRPIAGPRLVSAISEDTVHENGL